MEDLISELKCKINDMKNNTNNSIDLSDERLDDLYSVYPFNKFEYVIRANVEFYIFRVNFEFYLIKTVVSTGSTTSRKVIEPVEMTLKLRNKQFFLELCYRQPLQSLPR